MSITTQLVVGVVRIPWPEWLLWRDNLLAFQADVLDAKAREVVFTTIKEQFGYLDIVFANAGIGKSGFIAETSEELFDEVLRVNLTGVFLTIKSALPLLRSGSSIILNGSISEFVGYPPGAEFYAASKGGMHSMSRAMAAELSPLGIRINVVAPGPIRTPIQEGSGVRNSASRVTINASPTARINQVRLALINAG